MLLTRSSNSQASRHSDPCHSPPGTYRRVYHTLQIILGWSLQGSHPPQAAPRPPQDPLGPSRTSRRALKTSLSLPYDPPGNPCQTSQAPPKIPAKSFPNPGWHTQKGLPHLTDHSCVIVCTRGHAYSAGLRVGNTPTLYSISKRLAHTEGTATPYKSFLCYSVHARTRVLCRAPSWEHPCLIFHFTATQK